MWFKLTKANFSKNNIGTLDEWSISYSGLYGQYSGPTAVDKDATDKSATGTVTINSGATVNSFVITMGDTSISSVGTVGNITVSLSNNVYTISITEVTANVIISFSISSGGSTETEYSFTVNPTPSTATVTLTASGYSTVSGTGSKSITVANGTTVSWSVSASGYTTQSGTWTANGKSESKSVILDSASVGEVTTFFTTGTKGAKRESPTINGFTWVIPKNYLTSRVNAIKVPVYLYPDEYDYVDLVCEIMEPQDTGVTTAPTRKSGLNTITRMTSDGDAIFNISFSADDIESDKACLIGIRALEGKKIAFATTTGDWVTATNKTGSATADPCCTYYVTPGSSSWSSSSGANTRHLELLTDATAPAKYTLTYPTESVSKDCTLVRTSSQYGCVGGIASGADIYEGDILNITSVLGTIYQAFDDDMSNITMPITVSNNVNINNILTIEADGTFFENGTMNASNKDSIASGALDYVGWCWVMPKKFISLPVTKISVPSMEFSSDAVPVEVTCELLNSSKQVINGKTVTDTVTNATGGHDFNLSFTKNDITEDYCYIAIYITDPTKEFAFTKVGTSDNEWYSIIEDKDTYKPLYKYVNSSGNIVGWTTASSPNIRHIALKTGT